MPGIVQDKVAIVTGAGRGIGRAIAMLMAEEGAKVLVNDVGAALDGSGGDAGPAQQVVDEIKKQGGQAVASTLSIGDPANLVLTGARDWWELNARPQSDRVVIVDGLEIDRTLPDYRELDATM